MKTILRNRHVGLSFISVACVIAFALAWAWDAGYRINPTPSLPKGIYRVFPRDTGLGTPGKDDLVSFCLEGKYAAMAMERGYLGSGSCPSGLRPLLKRLAGLSGDTVNPTSLVLRAADSQGRPIPSVLQAGIIPPGMALVLADHEGSFDSRYFGLVPLEILQRVEPVLLCNSKGK